jgi:thiamine biosynthesis lipoprotein
MPESRPNKFIIAFLGVLLIGCIAGLWMARRDHHRSENLSRQFSALGVPVEIEISGPQYDCRMAMREIETVFLQLYKTLDTNDPRSEASRLNAGAADKPFHCSDLLWEVIQVSSLAYDKTDGCFDISVGPLLDLWGFKKKAAPRSAPPTDAEIAATLRRVGFSKLVLNATDRSVFFATPGMRLEFSGLIKGCFLQKAWDILRARHINQGIINFGNDVLVLELPNPSVSGYYVKGIPHPVYAQSQLIGKVAMRREAIAIIGDYEDHILIGNRKYCDIIDPRTGRPIEGRLGVTVISANAVYADFFAAGIFVGGEAVLGRLSAADPDSRVLALDGRGDDPKKQLTIMQYNWQWLK